MPEVPLTDLDPRLQEQVEKVRLALAQGNPGYVLAVGEPILLAHPGCLPVRRLVHAARLQQRAGKNPLLAKALGGLSRAPFFLSGRTAGPEAMRERADKLLAADPTSLTAWKLLAGAAAQLGWRETVVFAREAVGTLAPHDEPNLIALGEAWLTLGRPEAALEVAEGILRRRPLDGPAQNLMRQASVAQTMAKGNWEKTGDYRQKLKKDSRDSG
jgi:tetratricopeptide (TPR) repeat protein